MKRLPVFALAMPRRLRVSDLQDAVAHLLLQHELRIERHLGEHIVEGELAERVLAATPRPGAVDQAIGRCRIRMFFAVEYRS